MYVVFQTLGMVCEFWGQPSKKAEKSFPVLLSIPWSIYHLVTIEVSFLVRLGLNLFLKNVLTPQSLTNCSFWN